MHSFNQASPLTQNYAQRAPFGVQGYGQEQRNVQDFHNQGYGQQQRGNFHNQNQNQGYGYQQRSPFEVQQFDQQREMNQVCGQQQQRDYNQDQSFCQANNEFEPLHKHHHPHHHHHHHGGHGHGHKNEVVYQIHQQTQKIEQAIQQETQLPQNPQVYQQVAEMIINNALVSRQIIAEAKNELRMLQQQAASHMERQTYQQREQQLEQICQQTCQVRQLVQQRVNVQDFQQRDMLTQKIMMLVHNIQQQTRNLGNSSSTAMEPCYNPCSQQDTSYVNCNQVNSMNAFNPTL